MTHHYTARIQTAMILTFRIADETLNKTICPAKMHWNTLVVCVVIKFQGGSDETGHRINIHHKFQLQL